MGRSSRFLQRGRQRPSCPSSHSRPASRSGTNQSRRGLSVNLARPTIKESYEPILQNGTHACPSSLNRTLWLPRLGAARHAEPAHSQVLYVRNRRLFRRLWDDVCCPSRLAGYASSLLCRWNESTNGSDHGRLPDPVGLLRVADFVETRNCMECGCDCSQLVEHGSLRSFPQSGKSKLRSQVSISSALRVSSQTLRTDGMLIMNTRLLVLALLLLIAVTLHAQAKTDVIVMANSDRLNCEVTGPDTLTTPSDGYREHERTYG